MISHSNFAIFSAGLFMITIWLVFKWLDMRFEF
jgi:hypothetical protein